MKVKIRYLYYYYYRISTHSHQKIRSDSLGIDFGSNCNNKAANVDDDDDVMIDKKDPLTLQDTYKNNS